MKHIFYIFLVLFTTQTFSQTILPTIGTELCPNQEYTFSVSGLSGNYINLNAIGQVTITQFPSSNSGTSITFKAKFADVGGTQGFRISYNNGGPYEPKFTRIKSLMGGYYENPNNTTSIAVPICQTVPFTLHISGNQYEDRSTNPVSKFGSITKYKYKIPAGWFLNSTLSNGIDWITASGPINVTPDAFTGNSANIVYVAQNECCLF